MRGILKMQKQAIVQKTVACLNVHLQMICCELGLLSLQRLQTERQLKAAKLGMLEILSGTDALLERALLYLAQVEAALEAYKQGDLFWERCFEGALCLEGTVFQKAVWRKAREIPYGTTVSYGELAEAIGYAGASRAVGGALHQNKILLFVPCHRVVGYDGKLTGFGAGLDFKQDLLWHEQACRALQ